MAFVSKEITDRRSVTDIYRTFHTEPYFAALISGLDGHPHSGRSFAAARPFLIFEANGRRCKWIEPHTGVLTESDGNPFDVFYEKWQTLTNAFAIGYWGYDGKDHLEKLDDRAVREYDLPDAQWMFFEAIARVDHGTHDVVVEGDEEAVKKLEAMMAQPAVEPTRGARRFSIRPQWTESSYLNAVNAIRDHIRAGDVYEVNLTQRFHVDLSVSPSRDLELLDAMLIETPSPFTAILRTPASTVISSSPERFLKIHNSVMECEPIKGTRPRGRMFDEDEAAFLSLHTSEKDRAENLMIVDLTRNDLGRVAKIGSVTVPRLFHIDAYQTVFQMSSTVRAELADGLTWMDAVKSAFPPGSMTGAPKIAAMNIIEALEPVKRQIYSGVLGYIDWHGNIDLSVIIRTLILQESSGYFQTGGAIVWDSDPDSEYRECWDKAQGILRALTRWSESSGPLRTIG